jgi:orotidine-5'-phosphate decarboxylase
MVPIPARDRLIVALDLEGDDALSLARELSGTVRWIKVGMTLFYERGPQIVTAMREMGFDVFLDLKLHDIPHQVEGAAERIARLGVQMFTVHASGGAAMIEAAVRGADAGARAAGVERPAVLAVTVLTSMNDEMLAQVGVDRSAAEQVGSLARVAQDAGADGIVCSPQEAAAVRAILGEGAYVVTPGVRPEWAESGDQQRVQTPRQALEAGASHLVVGRPITGAEDPPFAAARIVSEMEGAAR